MLERVKIENFRCLRSVAVPLRPLTVLIGPNDSGKSAFLAALQHLAAPENLSHGEHWRFDRNIPISVCGERAGVRIETTASSAVGIRPGGTQNPLTSAGFYYLPSAGVSMQSDGQPDHLGPPHVAPDGTGVPALLDYLLRRDRTRFSGFVEAMRGLVPGVEEVEIATPDPTMRRVDLVIDNGFRIPGDRASAGVRLLVFFLALAYHPSPPKLILLEEPENGVHPKRLKDVMDLLRQVTRGVHGESAAQVVLTTHSPHLLDFVDVEHDQVLVFHRNEDGSRDAEPADAERLKTFLDEFMLGEVWFNEGEEGLTGRKV